MSQQELPPTNEPEPSGYQPSRIIQNWPIWSQDSNLSQIGIASDYFDRLADSEVQANTHKLLNQLQTEIQNQLLEHGRVEGYPSIVIDTPEAELHMIEKTSSLLLRTVRVGIPDDQGRLVRILDLELHTTDISQDASSHPYITRLVGQADRQFFPDGACLQTTQYPTHKGPPPIEEFFKQGIKHPQELIPGWETPTLSLEPFKVVPLNSEAESSDSAEETIYTTILRVSQELDRPHFMYYFYKGVYQVDDQQVVHPLNHSLSGHFYSIDQTTEFAVHQHIGTDTDTLQIFMSAGDYSDSQIRQCRYTTEPGIINSLSDLERHITLDPDQIGKPFDDRFELEMTCSLTSKDNQVVEAKVGYQGQAETAAEIIRVTPDLQVQALVGSDEAMDDVFMLAQHILVVPIEGGATNNPVILVSYLDSSGCVFQTQLLQERWHRPTSSQVKADSDSHWKFSHN